MLEEFKIKNFKCFKQFELDNLGRINIFLGPNNVGKSSILEAIFGYACGGNLIPLVDNVILRIGRNENENIYSLIEKALNTFNNKNELEFSFEGKFQNKEIKKFSYKLKPGSRFEEIEADLNTNYSIQPNFLKEGIKLDAYQNQISTELLFNLEVLRDGQSIKEESISYPRHFMVGLTSESPFKSAKYLNISNFKNTNELIRIYSLLKRDKRGLKDIICELNKAFQNTIEDIDMIPYPDGSQSPISIKTTQGKYIPIYEYGDGMQKWFSMIGNQLIYKNTIHCLDEIGDMLHPEAQGILGLNLSKIVTEHNNQVFATTQSLEFVENYLKYVFENEKQYLEDIRIITLKRVGQDIKARILSGERALELITENVVELR